MRTDTMLGVPAEALMRFPPFASAVGSLNDHSVTYVDSQLNVRLAPFEDVAPIFRGGAPEWREFCRGVLTPGGEVPHSAEYPGLHEWNQGFQWRNTRSDRCYLTPTQAEHFDQRGWFFLPGAVTLELVRSLEAEADRFEVLSERKLRSMREGQSFIARPDEITFTTHLVKRSKLFSGFYRSQLFRSICKDLIGDDVRLYWDQAVYKKPGVVEPFPWHQDNGYTYVEPQQYLTFWIALTEATLENGCMWMIPGIHRLGTVHHELTKIGYDCFPNGATGATAVPARPGDLIVLSSLTPHQTGSNTTSLPRKALVSQFVPSGAVAKTKDSWGQVVETPATDPLRQFEILRGGEPVV